MGLESVDDLINDLDQALQHACEYDQDEPCIGSIICIPYFTG